MGLFEQFPVRKDWMPLWVWLPDRKDTDSLRLSLIFYSKVEEMWNKKVKPD